MKGSAVQLLSAAALIIIFVFIVAFAILSAVLNYHWTHYGISAKNIEKVRFWYFGISFFLFAVMVISLMAILL